MRLRNHCVACLILLACAACGSSHRNSVKAVDSGNEFVKQAKYDDATRMYQRAVELDPRNGQAYYQLALLDWNLGRRSLEGNLRRAVELEPSNMDALTKLSELYLLSYRYDSDPTRRKTYLEQMQPLTAQMLQVQPRSYQGLRIQAYIAFLTGDYATADRLFDAALRAEPKSANAAEVASDRFSAMLHEGLTPAAETFAESYIRQYPSAKPVYDGLTKHYWDVHRPDLAIAVLRKKAEANRDDVQAILDLASGYRTAGSLLESEAVLNQIRNDPKRYPNGLEQISHFYVRFGDYDNASRALQDGEARTPSLRSMYRLKQCEILLRQRRLVEAGALLSDIRKAPAASLDDEISRIDLVSQLGFPDGTDRSINELIALQQKAPKDARVALALARAYQKQGRNAEADDVLHTAEFLAPESAAVRVARARWYETQNDFTRMRVEAQFASQLDPRDPEALLTRAVAAVLSNQAESARSDLETLEREWPEAPEPEHYLGVIDIAEGRTKSGEARLRKAASLKYAPSYLKLAELYNSQNRPDMAAQTLKQAIASGAATVKVRRGYASASAAAGDHATAVATLRQLVAEYPADAGINLALITELRRSENTPAALAAARAAVQKNGRDADLLVQLGDLSLAAGGSKTDARGIYQKAIAEQPNHPIAQSRLACILLDTGGALSEALSLAQQASRSSPDDPDVVRCLARALTANGLDAQSVAVLERMLERHPENVQLQLELTALCMRKACDARARTVLEMAIRSRPTAQEASRARTVLERTAVTPGQTSK